MAEPLKILRHVPATHRAEGNLSEEAGIRSKRETWHGNVLAVYILTTLSSDSRLPQGVGSTSHSAATAERPDSVHKGTLPSVWIGLGQDLQSSH